MKLRPIYGWVIIQADTEEKVSAMGIIEIAKEATKVDFGTVLAVGTGKVRKDGSTIPIPFGPGEKVKFFRHNAYVTEHEREKLIFVECDSVFCVVE